MPPAFQSFRRILSPDLRGMSHSHAPDFVYHLITADALADDICEFLTEFSVTHCQTVWYSFVGLIALMVNALYSGAVSDLVLLEPALFEQVSIDELRALRAQYATVASALLSDGGPVVGVTQFLDLISPNRFTLPRVERIKIQRWLNRPKGRAHA